MECDRTGVDSMIKRIEFLERVRFEGYRTISWERSMDGGHTWEAVDWGVSRLPLVRDDLREYYSAEDIQRWQDELRVHMGGL
jgi:hypothetical protein